MRINEITDHSNSLDFDVSSRDDFVTNFEVNLIGQGGKDIGFFAYQYFPETDEVENDVSVLPMFQGQGYGKMLLLKAIETAEQHKLPFKADRNGITPSQRHVYQSLINDRRIRINRNQTVTLL
mgnify:CR=1 FL=1